MLYLPKAKGSLHTFVLTKFALKKNCHQLVSMIYVRLILSSVKFTKKDTSTEHMALKKCWFQIERFSTIKGQIQIQICNHSQKTLCYFNEVHIYHVWVKMVGYSKPLIANNHPACNI